MSSFAEALERLASNPRLLRVHRDGLETSLRKQAILVVQTCRATAALDDGRGFNPGRRGQQAHFGLFDDLSERALLRLSREDGNNGRGVDDHQRGRPSSP